MTLPPKPLRVLFVCLGNICRSPAAEGVMRSVVEKAGKSTLIEIDSAGTIGHHQGHGADQRMKAAAAARGYVLDSLARQVIPRDITTFDLVVAMDRQNYRDLQRLTQGVQAHIRLLSDFLDQGSPLDVPDPYYGGAEGFEEVLDMLETACPRILNLLAERLDRKDRLN